MALSSAQLSALKAAILADATLNAFPHDSDGAFAIAAALNLQAAPDFYVWRSTVTVDEIMQNGFDWTRVDNLTIGKSRIWEWMAATNVLRPNQANVRAGWLAVFTTAGDLSNRTAIAAHAQRLATRAEKLFASGSGTASTDQFVGPATMTFEGQLQYTDVVVARAS